MPAHSRGRERASIHDAPWRPGGGTGKPWQDASKLQHPERDDERWAGARARIDNGRRAPRAAGRSGGAERRRISVCAPAARMDWWGQASTSSEFRLSFRSDTLNSTKRLAAQGLRQRPVGQVPVFTGLETFTLRSLALTSLHGLGVHPEVKRIYMQNNVLTSFEGWEVQPRLEELHAEDNCIETFRGLAEQPRLEVLWLKGNPVTKLYCYRLMCCAAVGKSLRIIDGEPVKKHEMDRAMSLGGIVAEAIRDGWVLDTVPAPGADYDMVLEQYAYFRKKSQPLAQWAAATAPLYSEDDDEEDALYASRRSYGSRVASPIPSRPSSRSGSRAGSRAASPFHPPSRSPHAGSMDYDGDDVPLHGGTASPGGILRLHGSHGKSAASLRERLSGVGAEWAHSPVGERGGKPVRARVQVAKLLDILTTESHVLEAQLERQLEAQLEVLASVQARSPASRRDEGREAVAGVEGGGEGVMAKVSSSVSEDVSPQRKLALSLSAAAAASACASPASILKPHTASNGHSYLPSQVAGAGGGGGMLDEGTSLHESQAGRADAMAASVGSVDAVNGDKKLVSLLQDWATLREGRAALRRAILVEDASDDDADVRYSSTGSGRSRRRSQSREWERSQEDSGRNHYRVSSNQYRTHTKDRPGGRKRLYRAGGLPSFLATGGRPLTSRALKRAVLEQWETVLSSSWDGGGSSGSSEDDVLDRGRMNARVGERRRERERQARRELEQERVTERKREEDTTLQERKHQREFESAGLGVQEREVERSEGLEGDLTRDRSGDRDQPDAPKDPFSYPERVSSQDSVQSSRPSPEQSSELSAASALCKDGAASPSKAHPTEAGTINEKGSSGKLLGSRRLAKAIGIAGAESDREKKAKEDRTRDTDGGKQRELQRQKAKEREKELEKEAEELNKIYVAEAEKKLREEEERERLKREIEEQVRKEFAEKMRIEDEERKRLAKEDMERERQREAEREREERAREERARQDREREEKERQREAEREREEREREERAREESARQERERQEREREEREHEERARQDQQRREREREAREREEQERLERQRQEREREDRQRQEREREQREREDREREEMEREEKERIERERKEKERQDRERSERERKEEEEREERQRAEREQEYARAREQERAREKEEEARRREEARLSEEAEERQRREDFEEEARRQHQERERERLKSDSFAPADSPQNTRPSTPSQVQGEVPSTKKKKKKKEDERDAQGRRTLLNDCEVRGEASVGEKLTAFAKRVKKVPIGCTFQWYRVDPASGRESKILGQDRASYVVKEEDCGYVLKVTSSPTVKETGEEGQPVSASTDGPVPPGHTSSHVPAAQEGDAYGAMPSAAPPAAAEAPPAQSEEGSEPCLTDWKIEMNPDQEYTDPIKIHYQ